MNAPVVLPQLTDVDEESLLKTILDSRPRRLLVASDLHLGPGRRPFSQTYYVDENFFGDEAFARWLSFYSREEGSPSLLVLNGDIFDFTRISTCPRTDEDFKAWAARLAEVEIHVPVEQLRRAIRRHERRYGLQTPDYKSVWKLHHVLRGHEGWRAAAATWVEKGNSIILMKGNHDLELYWPAVRHSFRCAVARTLTDPTRALNHVAFAQTAMEFANIYFEHGHQYEPMTRVVGPPTLEDSPRHLNYPLGSFMNRYLINPLERLDPFIDNIKPVQQALLKIVRNHPFHMVRLYVRAWRFLNRALQMRRMWDGPAVTIAAALFVPPLFAGLVVLFVVLPDAWAAVESRLSWLTRGRALAGGGIVGVLFPALLPYAVGFLQEMGRAFGLFKPRDPVAEGAHAVLERFARGNRWRRVYVVMGHTHRQDVQTRSAGYRYETYINTGTWIPLWPLDRQDLVGRIIYSFAQFDLTEEGEYAHLMLQWDDQAGHPRAARILARGPERYEDEC